MPKKLIIPAEERYDEVNNEFIYTKEHALLVEHSLVSISKWESKWQKPFMGKEAKTEAEIVDYIRCMTLTQNVNEEVYEHIPPQIINEISEYIESPQSATWFREDNSKSISREIITSELIYYWMISLQIPMECQKWHLNRLLTLIRVCSIKNAPPKKMSQKDLLSRNKSLNAARRAKYNSKG